MKITLFYTLFLANLVISCQKDEHSYSVDQEIERTAKKFVVFGRTP
jgi:hypothetical protein